MNYKTITERLKRVAAIVDGWQDENGAPQIERDIALGELREIYNALLVVDTEQVNINEDIDETAAEEREIEVEVVVENPCEELTSAASDVASIESFYDALDIDALLGLTDEPSQSKDEPEINAEESVEELQLKVDEEVIEDVVVEPTQEDLPVEENETSTLVAEAASEPVAEPVAEEPKTVGVGLFDLNDIPVRSKSRRKMISLYSDNPIPTQTTAESVKPEPKVEQSEPKPEPVPVVEVAPKDEAVPVVEPVNVVPQQRLGDTFGEVKTLADQMAKNDTPTTPFNRITELRQAIGLNDKFLMIRDLFGGDAVRYEATIDTLDEFEDLDECIIYIVENFRWNPDLEATKLLVSLIERKLA